MTGIAVTVESVDPSFTKGVYAALQEMKDGEHIRTCLQCGTCSGVCPFGYLMDFPPGRMVAALRAGLFDKVLNTDTVWMCVSCYACAEVCPAKIPLRRDLMTRAKEELLLAGNIPTELQNALENSQRYGNPLGESPRKRADWARGLEPEVADHAAKPGTGGRPVVRRRLPLLSSPGAAAARALAKMLNALDVDFGILGPEENSDGDSQRLAGERGLFEMLAEKNGEPSPSTSSTRSSPPTRMPTTPSRTSIRRWASPIPVRHYTQFLAERLDHLKPLPETGSRSHGHIPRSLLSGPRQRRVRRTAGTARRRSPAWSWWRCRTTAKPACAAVAVAVACGWMASSGRRPMSACRNGVCGSPGCAADILAVACPYEAPRFEDAAKMVQGAGQLVVKDIAELLAESMG